MAGLERPLLWVASSKRDYKELPSRVQDGFGFELFLVQTGQHPPSAKPLKGLGSGTLEPIENFDGDTYRAVYSVRFKEAVYDLHAFKKKSKRGSEDTAGGHRIDRAATEGRRRGSCQSLRQGHQNDDTQTEDRSWHRQHFRRSRSAGRRAAFPQGSDRRARSTGWRRQRSSPRRKSASGSASASRKCRACSKAISANIPSSA